MAQSFKMIKKELMLPIFSFSRFLGIIIDRFDGMSYIWVVKELQITQEIKKKSYIHQFEHSFIQHICIVL